MKKDYPISQAALRQAVADYIGSEGCDCCQGVDHDAHKARLAMLLGVKTYKDGSGWNFSPYQTKGDVRHG